MKLLYRRGQYHSLSQAHHMKSQYLRNPPQAQWEMQVSVQTSIHRFRRKSGSQSKRQWMPKRQRDQSKREKIVESECQALEEVKSKLTTSYIESMIPYHSSPCAAIHPLDMKAEAINCHEIDPRMVSMTAPSIPVPKKP